MSEPLALKYRPRTFIDMVGQRPVATVLHYMIHQPVPGGRLLPREEPTVPPGMLFAGTRGSGKTSAARILGAALNCTAPGRRPCTQCPSCVAVQDGTSTAVTELDAASHGLVSDIRQLVEMVSYDVGAARRVVILDEAHAMSRDAFNALLKTLEEPPPRTVFVLVTTEHAKVLGTVASRCMPFPFTRIAPEAIVSRLRYIQGQEQVPACDDTLLAEFADRADGAMRDAVMLLEQAIQARIFTLEAFRALHGESDFAPQLLMAAVRGLHAEMFAQVSSVLSQTGDVQSVTAQLVRCLRDILVLHAGGTLTAQGASLSRRQVLARMLPVPRATAALRVLWDLQTRVRASDPQAALELAVVMCSEAMREPAESANYVIPCEPPKTNGHSLSIADIGALAAEVGSI